MARLEEKQESRLALCYLKFHAIDDTSKNEVWNFK